MDKSVSDYIDDLFFQSLNHSNEGDIVLDPFAGSGVVMEVAKRNNRKYTCIEIEGIIK